MKKSEKSERRKKKKEEENFWKIMYLTTDDDDDHNPVVPTTQRKKLPLLPFKKFNKRKWRAFQQFIYSHPKTFIAGGLLAGGLLAKMGFDVYNGTPIANGLLDVLGYLLTPFKKDDGTKISDEDKVKITKFITENANDKFIKELLDIDFNMDKAKTKKEGGLNSLINYFIVSKLLMEKVNGYIISKQFLEKIKMSPDDDYIIGNVCNFLEAIRKQLNLKADCEEDMKFTMRSSVATSTYLGYLEHVDKSKTIDYSIKYDNDTVKIKVTKTGSQCKGTSFYLQDVFEKP